MHLKDTTGIVAAKTHVTSRPVPCDETSGLCLRSRLDWGVGRRVWSDLTSYLNPGVCFAFYFWTATAGMHSGVP